MFSFLAICFSPYDVCDLLTETKAKAVINALVILPGQAVAQETILQSRFVRVCICTCTNFPPPFHASETTTTREQQQHRLLYDPWQMILFVISAVFAPVVSLCLWREKGLFRVLEVIAARRYEWDESCCWIWRLFFLPATSWSHYTGF